MTVSDQVTLSIIGDEVGEIILQKSTDLDFTDSEEISINGGEFIGNYTLEEKAFYRVIAE